MLLPQRSLVPCAAPAGGLDLLAGLFSACWNLLERPPWGGEAGRGPECSPHLSEEAVGAAQPAALGLGLGEARNGRLLLRGQNLPGPAERLPPPCLLGAVASGPGHELRPTPVPAPDHSTC